MLHPDISQWLLTYGYWVIFPLTIIEGPVTMVTAGILASLGILNVFLVYITIVIGDLTGDCLYYAIGRWGRRPLERWGKFIGLPKEKIDLIEKHFSDHSGKTLIAGKLSHAIGGIVLLSAGIAKIPFKKFLWFNFWATLPKSLILLLIGFYFGNTFLHFKHYLDWLGTLLIAIILVIVYFFLKKTGRKLSDNEKI